MINVDGDYDEIVAWMDKNPVSGSFNVHSHGDLDDGGDDQAADWFNVGLFSLEEDHWDYYCRCKDDNGEDQSYGWAVYDKEAFPNPNEYYFAVEKPVSRHLVSF